MRIVIHCSDSPKGRGDDAAVIHRWHQDRGWDGIGYHYVILEDGTRQAGRPEYWVGAHVSGHNQDSIGVCLIGIAAFTKEQMVALRNLIVELQARYAVTQVCGHYQLDSRKTCPNFDVSAWLESQDLVTAA